MEDPWGQVFYSGDSNMICIFWCWTQSVLLRKARSLARRWRTHYCLADTFAPQIRLPNASSLNKAPVPKRYWRELCRETYRNPDNLNQPASPLVRVPYSWSGGHDIGSRGTEFGALTESGRPSRSEVFYNICLSIFIFSMSIFCSGFDLAISVIVFNSGSCIKSA